ncbi:S1 family peptidase [Thalassobellus suaedae]|uniref:Serine protease n=1 Tax=Thalassobellus suaedae TaxID=3074124 RepID=A0ABY9XP86_9FLAO|nr:serine protease [Flavobacteriaceae bacterium HL-DH14]
MSNIEAATCKIIIEKENGKKEKGTGFFINKNQVLTCSHVISNDVFKIEISKIGIIDEGNTFTLKVVDQCNICDYALLEIEDDFENENTLNLCNSEIINEENIKIFGYPDTTEGQTIGKELKGSIDRYIIDNTESIHDIILSIPTYSRSENYKAFSGSPIINDFGQVLGILKYRDEQHLAAVSIKKALSFLEKNKIVVKPDQLQSFEVYNDKTFLGFEKIKSKCEVESQVPIKILSPGKILDANKGELFYPKNPQNINDLIKILRKSKDVDSKLWTGWIQLLTYVEILKGDYKDPNNISIHITSNELYKKFGLINTSRNVNMKIYLNFYFTEEESYLKIASKLIHEKKKGGLSKNVCNIFNSNVDDFGNTNNIKEDISNPTGSGPSIQNYKIGRLSLSQLNREVKSSNPIGQVSDNLKKIFEDAIK